MQRFYGVKASSRIKVSMVSPRKIAKVAGEDGVLGIAVNKGDSHRLLMMNGAATVPSLATMMHELTHIWQYENWDRVEIARRYASEVPLHPNPEAAALIVYEGMATWTEVQYMKLLGESEYAQRYMSLRLSEPSVYGAGLALFFKRYGFSSDAFIGSETPFSAGLEPLG